MNFTMMEKPNRNSLALKYKDRVEGTEDLSEDAYMARSCQT